MNGNLGKLVADYAVQCLSPALLVTAIVFVLLAAERCVAITRFGSRVVGPEEVSVMLLVAMLTLATRMVLYSFWSFG